MTVMRLHGTRPDRLVQMPRSCYKKAVKVYQVTPELAGFSSKRILLRGLLSGGLFGVIEVIGHFLWPSLYSGRLVDFFISVIIFAGVTMAFDMRKFDYKVFVSDDCITTGRNRYQRSVRKNEVKTVTECDGNVLLAPSLRISKYGWFGTWLWGGIWIPKALPEHTSIRDLALSWIDSTKIEHTDKLPRPDKRPSRQSGY